MKAADGLARIIRPGLSSTRIRTVVAVNPDGTVTLDWGLDETGAPTLVDVACEAGYAPRAVGDIVRVQVDDTIGWLVVGRLSGNIDGVPYATASGDVRVQAVANATVAVTVTFPAGRFGPIDTYGRPRVFPNLRLTNPNQGAVSAGTADQDSVVLRVYSSVTSDPVVDWFAVQGVG